MSLFRLRSVLIIALILLNLPYIILADPIQQGTIVLNGPRLSMYLHHLRPNTPLNGDTFVSAGLMYNVDPRLVAGIALAETQLGTDGSACTAVNNAFNWFKCLPSRTCTSSDSAQIKCQRSAYQSWDQGIQDVTKWIRRSKFYFSSGKDVTLEKIRDTYCCPTPGCDPPNFCNLNPSQGCCPWLPNVAKIYDWSVSFPNITPLPGNRADLGFNCGNGVCDQLNTSHNKVPFDLEACTPNDPCPGACSLDCRIQNQPPTITGLTPDPTSVQAGGQSMISVVASDPDDPTGDSLTYMWSVESDCGSLSSMTGKEPKVWTAPDTASTCTVSVTVTDPTGASAMQSVDIEVTLAPSTAFKVGNRIQVNTGDGSHLNVRSSPGGSAVGQQPDGTLGTVIDGPQFVDGRWWWQVDFDTGMDGWVAEDFIDTLPLPSIPLSYASFSVFNRTTPTSATGVAAGGAVSVLNRTGPSAGGAGERVATIDNLNVRNAPGLSATVLGVQPPGTLGTVIGGPVFADGFRWWRVDFDTGVDGWVVQDFLEPPLEHIQSVHTTLAVFNSTAPDAISGHTEGPVFSVDNLP